MNTSASRASYSRSGSKHGPSQIRLPPTSNFCARKTPVWATPTWKQFLAIVRDIRSQKFSADAQDSADLVEFMGKAGAGTAECAGLCGEHIDFQNKRITLYRHKTATGYTIPLFPQLHGLLDN